MTDFPASQRCQGRKRNGDPCGSIATQDGHCAWHSPSIPDSVKTDWARSGGLSHQQKVLDDLEAVALKSPKDAKKLLARMIKHVLGGTLLTSRANSAGFLLRVLAELEGAMRKKADLAVEITVNVVRFDTPANDQEATPTPRVIVTARPKGIASEAGTSPQPPQFPGDLDG